MRREWGSRISVLHALEDTGPKEGYLKSRNHKRECFHIYRVDYIYIYRFMIQLISKCGGPIFRLPEFIQEINSFNSGMLVQLYPLLMCCICMTGDVPSKAIIIQLDCKNHSHPALPIRRTQEKSQKQQLHNSKVIGKTPFGGPPLKDNNNKLQVLHCDGWIFPPVTYPGLRGHSKLIQESSTAGDRSAVEQRSGHHGRLAGSCWDVRKFMEIPQIPLKPWRPQIGGNCEKI